MPGTDVLSIPEPDKVGDGRRNGVKETYNIPVAALQKTTLDQLSCLLDPETHLIETKTGLQQNWQGLAELMSCTYDEIKELEGKNQKTSHLISLISEKKQTSLTVGGLLDYIKELGREDVLENENLQKYLDRDSREYNRRQGNEVASDQPQHFDAFICSPKQDIVFVKMLMEKLEEEEHFKLFLPDRNLMLGTPEFAALASIMENECASMLVILSEHFESSEECNWMVKQWHSTKKEFPRPTIIIVTSKDVKVPEYLSIFIPLRYRASDSFFFERLKESLLASSKSLCQPQTETAPSHSTRQMTQTSDDSNTSSATTSGAGHQSVGESRKEKSKPKKLKGLKKLLCVRPSKVKS